ncbi:MAG: hypothetical protein H7318_13825 [Oligoflexus sp.]|nr:hypothetical protein [Oligoflexus sp.]
MTKALFLTLSLVNILVMVTCQAGPSERRQSFLTENLEQEDQSETEVPSGKGTSTTESGTGVNNGIGGPIGEIHSCLGEDDHSEKVTFSIHHTAALSYKQGVLKIGEESITMKCDQVKSDPNEKPVFDKSKALWTCSESREGEGLYHVTILMHGFTGMTLGTVTVDQISPLQPAHVATMGCKK